MSPVRSLHQNSGGIQGNLRRNSGECEEGAGESSASGLLTFAKLRQPQNHF